jgi:hypothetical protein
LKVYCNFPHPKATLVAWGNQGLTGAIDKGQNPDKAQWQAFANAVEQGTPLYREWSGRYYTWPKGSTPTPILMDLEPLWFDERRSESERLHWHVKVAEWIKNAYPGVKLMSYTGLNLNLRNCTPFVKTQWAICPGDYFSTDLEHRMQFWLDWERDKILDYRQAYPGKQLIWFTKSTFAAEWSPRLVNESTGQNETDVEYDARMRTITRYYDAIIDNIGPYVDGVFIWEQEQAISPQTDEYIRRW